MEENKNVDRRQFVRKTVAAAGLAATAAASSRLMACPISSDGDASDWFCIIDMDNSNPVYTIYTWKNCRTGQTYQTIGTGTEPMGNCGSPNGDPSCLKGIEIGRWEDEKVGDITYKIHPDLEPEIRRKALRLLADHAEG